MRLCDAIQRIVMVRPRKPECYGMTPQPAMQEVALATGRQTRRCWRYYGHVETIPDEATKWKVLSLTQTAARPGDVAQRVTYRRHQTRYSTAPYSTTNGVNAMRLSLVNGLRPRR